MKNKKISMYKGLPLVDATSDIKISITRGDVTKAKKNDPNNCAAAKAIEREYQTDAEVHISRTYIKDAKNKVWIRFKTPQSISREIVSFDRSAIFEPGNYILKAPSERERLGHPRVSSKKTGTGRSTRPMHMTVNVRESAR